MKRIFLILIYLLGLFVCEGQRAQNFQRNTNQANQKKPNISDGHRLITRALWRIFDALLEKKNHEQLYGRVRVAEDALANTITKNENLEKKIISLEENLKALKDEIESTKKSTESTEQRIQSLEEWQLRVGGQMDHGEHDFLGWAEAAYTSCPTPFELVGGECVHVVINQKKSWPDARIACGEIGGDLAAPRNLPEFRNYLRTLPSEKRPTYAWIGATRTEENGWVWAAGSKPGRPMDMSEETWNVDLPNGIGDCAGLFELSGYRSYDYKCEETDNFICQYFF